MIILLEGSKENVEKFLDKKFNGKDLVQFDLSKVENPKEKMLELSQKEPSNYNYVFLTNDEKGYSRSLIYFVNQYVKILDQHSYQYLKTS